MTSSRQSSTRRTSNLGLEKGARASTKYLLLLSVCSFFLLQQVTGSELLLSSTSSASTTNKPGRKNGVSTTSSSPTTTSASSLEELLFTEHPLFKWGHSLYSSFFGSSKKGFDGEKIFRLQLQKCEGKDEVSIHGLWPEWAEYCPGPKFHKSGIEDLMPRMEADWFSCQSRTILQAEHGGERRYLRSSSRTTSSSSSKKSNTWFWTHEWERHGTCSEFPDEHSYFAKVLDLYDQYKDDSRCKGKELCHVCLTPKEWQETKCPYWRPQRGSRGKDNLLLLQQEVEVEGQDVEDEEQVEKNEAEVADDAEQVAADEEVLLDEVAGQRKPSMRAAADRGAPAHSVAAEKSNDEADHLKQADTSADSLFRRFMAGFTQLLQRRASTSKKPTAPVVVEEEYTAAEN
ncbi:unnamed protein product [Amoebophrya sp. A25]|nr:unnamed protein product [Amoebophrya sp. A25]|eukprot:GSA25T00003010001.1